MGEKIVGHSRAFYPWFDASSDVPLARERDGVEPGIKRNELDRSAEPNLRRGRRLWELYRRRPPCGMLQACRNVKLWGETALP